MDKALVLRKKKMNQGKNLPLNFALSIVKNKVVIWIIKMKTKLLLAK